MPYNRDAMSGRAERVVVGVDERAVMPGSGIELLDGKALTVPGADPPHASRHFDLTYVLGAHVAAGFRGAVDMLTRSSVDSDFAPDASVYPAEPDEESGGRQLEVLAFEVVSSQRLAVASSKARALSGRGVPRIFALVLAKNRVLEWDRRAASPGGRWRPLHPDEVIEHPCLAVPLPIRALLDASRADEAVLAALEARRPDLVGRIRAEGEARGAARGRAEGEAIGEARGRAEGEARGRADGEAIGEALGRLRGTIIALCEVLGVSLDEARTRRIERGALSELEAIVDALREHRCWPDG